MFVVLPASTFGQKKGLFSVPLPQQVKLEAEKPPCLNPHEACEFGKVEASCWVGAVVPGFSVRISCPLLQWLGTVTS